MGKYAQSSMSLSVVLEFQIHFLCYIPQPRSSVERCLLRLAAKPRLQTPSLPPLFSYVIPAGTLQLNCKPLPAHQPSSIADNPLQELFPGRKATFFYLEFLVYAQPLHSCFPPWPAPLWGRNHFPLLIFVPFYVGVVLSCFCFQVSYLHFVLNKIVCGKGNRCGFCLTACLLHYKKWLKKSGTGHVS